MKEAGQLLKASLLGTQRDVTHMLKLVYTVPMIFNRFQ